MFVSPRLAPSRSFLCPIELFEGNIKSRAESICPCMLALTKARNELIPSHHFDFEAPV